jgi:hypothetical protein
VAIRDFTDGDGVRWSVWSTLPTAKGVVGSLRQGWLTFEAGGDRRRLAPIPLNWENASLSELRAMCARAGRLQRTPATGSWRIFRDEPDAGI